MVPHFLVDWEAGRAMLNVHYEDETMLEFDP
jgi:hypothetical protein